MSLIKQSAQLTALAAQQQAAAKDEKLQDTEAKLPLPGTDKHAGLAREELVLLKDAPELTPGCEKCTSYPRKWSWGGPPTGPEHGFLELALLCPVSRLLSPPFSPTTM